MFTGIIDEIGEILQIRGPSSILNIKIKCDKILRDIELGDSISVSGVCLTVTNTDSGYFEASVSKETLISSAYLTYKKGTKVNLEHSLTLSDKLSGHLVLGHVDGTVNIRAIKALNGFYVAVFNYPLKFNKYLAYKGSVCLDGISLTISKIEETFFEVAIIPHTFKNTTLKYKKAGDIVNLEVDVIARYLEKMIKVNTTDINTMLNNTYFEGFFDE
jgi:riboflavin synthase